MIKTQFGIIECFDEHGDYANQNLSRVEGIINIAIIGKQIIIPPIYGNCDLAEISRYKKTIAFLYQYLINR